MLNGIHARKVRHTLSNRHRWFIWYQWIEGKRKPRRKLTNFCDAFRRSNRTAKPLQASDKHCIRAIMLIPEKFVGSPVHSFGYVWERGHHVCGAT